MDVIRAARRRRGFSQREFSRLAGYCPRGRVPATRFLVEEILGIDEGS